MTPTFNRILVPIDFSSGSRLAVDYTVQLAHARTRNRGILDYSFEVTALRAGVGDPAEGVE